MAGPSTNVHLPCSHMPRSCMVVNSRLPATPLHKAVITIMVWPLLVPTWVAAQWISPCYAAVPILCYGMTLNHYCTPCALPALRLGCASMVSYIQTHPSIFMPSPSVIRSCLPQRLSSLQVRLVIFVVTAGCLSLQEIVPHLTGIVVLFHSNA